MSGPLSEDDVRAFVRDGFVRVDHAFSSEVAAKARDILWRATGFDPNDRATWSKPIVRIGYIGLPPFVEAANSPRLHGALNQIAGAGRWLARMDLGTFPIRFPSREEPGDTGWHVDGSIVGEESSDPFSARINLESRDRLLLMLFLFSDVGESDAPTRLRVGSHRDVARLLMPFGTEGLSFMELAQKLDVTDSLPEAIATGPAGTVYLCHPFLVHAAQAHRGQTPKFMAQPPLHPYVQVQLSRDDDAYSPVEQAIREAIGFG